MFPAIVYGGSVRVSARRPSVSPSLSIPLSSCPLSAVKRAEDDDRLIVRLAETHGGHGRATIDWALPVRTVEVVDLLERALAMDGFAHDAAQRRTTMNIRPFQIVTLAARR